MTDKYRAYSFVDRMCLSIDQVVRALSNNIKTTECEYPAKNIDEVILDSAQQKHVAALMRINHAGEICAQALYHGQALVARTPVAQDNLQLAALEEGNHLLWCQLRLNELGSHTSYLNPLWYGGSFCIGIIAGMMGDPWSLGFVAETEHQVIKHLQKHLDLLPQHDERSQRILVSIQTDEAKHQAQAISLGAKNLPNPIKKIMSVTAKIMVNTAYYI